MARRWLILASIVLLSFFQYGSLKALEINVPRLIDQLGMTATEAGLTCSIAAAMATLLGPIWKACAHGTSDRFVTAFGGLLMGLGLIIASFVSHRILIHFCMALLGIGRGLPMVSKIVVVREYFDDKTFNRANGIASSGGSLGLFLVPPFVEALNHVFGWRGGLLIFGGLCFHSGFAGCLMKGRFCWCTWCSSGSADQADKGRRSCPNICEVLGFATLKRHPSFVIELIAFTLLDLALYGWILFLFTFLTSNGVSYPIASGVSALGGAGSLLGRLVFGHFLDTVLSARKLIATSALIASVTLALYPFDMFGISYWWWGTLTFLTGIFAGTTTPVYTALIEEKFSERMRDFSSAIGLHYMMRGIGMLSGGPLTGHIYDQTGSFDLAFYVLAGFQFFGGALMCLELVLKKKHCLSDLESSVSSAEERESEKMNPRAEVEKDGI